jgi:hypothetical protein
LYENRFFFKRKITSLYFIFIGVPNFICKKARPKSRDGVVSCRSKSEKDKEEGAELTA